MTYTIVLLDHDGFDVGSSEAENLKEAKKRARYLISDDYARNTESTHDQTQKVEVRDEAGDCVWDLFHPNARNHQR